MELGSIAITKVMADIAGQLEVYLNSLVIAE
jgi:hypothetical protein